MSIENVPDFYHMKDNKIEKYMVSWEEETEENPDLLKVVQFLKKLPPLAHAKTLMVNPKKVKQIIDFMEYLRRFKRTVEEEIETMEIQQSITYNNCFEIMLDFHEFFTYKFPELHKLYIEMLEHCDSIQINGFDGHVQICFCVEDYFIGIF